VIKITFKGIIKVTGDQGFELIGKSLPFSVIIIVIPVLSLITILLYKNRKIQSWFAFTAIIMAVLLIIISIYYSYFEWSSIELSLLVGLKMIIPVLILICSILAYLGIRKDERIIKSYDRLR
jgi:phosphoglycerol transferase MdoB-like AlkP superfamily enzyme